MTTAQLDWRTAENGEAVLAVRGACTMQRLPELLAEIDAQPRAPAQLDLGELEGLDSAGALVLLRLLSRQRQYVEALARVRAARPEHRALLQLVAERASVAPAPAVRRSM